MTLPKEETTEELLQKLKDNEFRTDIAAVEQLLSEAKKTQSSSEGYAFRAIGWALHSIAFDLHDINHKLDSLTKTGEKE